MSAEAIMSVLASAAQARATVALSVRADLGATSLEVEPYSVHTRAGIPTLFCWDTSGDRVIGFPVDALVGAHTTDHSFTPRYEIEL